MFGEIDRLVASALCRVLELDTELTMDDAIARVSVLLEDMSIADPGNLVSRVAPSLQRQGILNPIWLEDQGLRPHFFMASSRPGYLKQLVRLSEERRAGISQYILYGEWDALVVLSGSDDEAAHLRDSLESSSVEPPLYFPARSVLSRRHFITTPRNAADETDPTLANALVADFDREDLQSLRRQMLEAGQLLGSVWTRGGASPYPVSAFLGISLRGRGNVETADVVHGLLSDDHIRDALVDLYEVEQGRPFHYFAKLACQTMSELDDVTTLIGSASVAGVRAEGTTFVVANGTESMPTVRRDSLTPDFGLGIDLSPLVSIAERAISELPASTQQSFSELTELRQLSVVKSIVELQRRLDNANLTPDAHSRFESALATFVRECATATDTPNLTGAIADAVIAVEGIVRRLLSKLAYSCLGNDGARIQTELRLPTKNISKLSMGKVLSALRICREHEAFAEYRDALTEEALERLDGVASQRNEWLHDAANSDGSDVVEDARRLIVRAIETAKWAEAIVVSIGRSPSAAYAGEIAVSATRRIQPSVFVSHAKADAVVAERIAAGLKVFGIPTWYSEWELQPGDSIVERVETAIAQSDVLIVLLSPRSVGSKWVSRELNSALASQLAGDDVAVVPVLIEKCDIPALLVDILRVDLSENFEAGLFGLIEFLRERSKPEP